MTTPNANAPEDAATGDAASWDSAHRSADAVGHDGYFDPDTGLFVMTEGYHLRRGHCCNSSCRHCPYN